MMLRGTRVKRQLEFFAWIGWVIGDFQTRSGVRMIAVEIDYKESTDTALKEGYGTSNEVRIFCCKPSELEILGKIERPEKILPELKPSK